MKNISSKVKTSYPEFDMCGKAKYFFKESSNSKGLSTGLKTRLYNYALDRLDSCGVRNIVLDWDCSIDKLDDYYQVNFYNGKGATIAVNGIFTNKGGWPFLDHGISLDD